MSRRAVDVAGNAPCPPSCGFRGAVSDLTLIVACAGPLVAAWGVREALRRFLYVRVWRRYDPR